MTVELMDSIRVCLACDTTNNSLLEKSIMILKKLNVKISQKNIFIYNLVINIIYGILVHNSYKTSNS